jgi:hypothetical protein
MSRHVPHGAGRPAEPHAAADDPRQTVSAPARTVRATGEGSRQVRREAARTQYPPPPFPHPTITSTKTTLNTSMGNQTRRRMNPPLRVVPSLLREPRDGGFAAPGPFGFRPAGSNPGGYESPNSLSEQSGRTSGLRRRRRGRRASPSRRAGSIAARVSLRSLAQGQSSRRSLSTTRL